MLILIDSNFTGPNKRTLLTINFSKNNNSRHQNYRTLRAYVPISNYNYNIVRVSPSASSSVNKRVLTPQLPSVRQTSHFLRRTPTVRLLRFHSTCTSTLASLNQRVRSFLGTRFADSEVIANVSSRPTGQLAPPSTGHRLNLAIQRSARGWRPVAGR